MAQEATKRNTQEGNMGHGSAKEGQYLIFDADDTLWENNVHFERAIEDFLDSAVTCASVTSTWLSARSPRRTCAR